MVHCSFQRRHTGAEHSSFGTARGRHFDPGNALRLAIASAFPKHRFGFRVPRRTGLLQVIFFTYSTDLISAVDCRKYYQADRGLGLTADIIDHCKLKLKYPEGTNSTWVNQQFKKNEPLEYEYDVCEAVLLWEQYRNVTTVLTREYLDVRPDGWFDYAAKRIAQLGAKKCYNQSLCDELLSPILPAKPPFHPRQFERCAVVGNSGDLLLTEFGEEIDSHGAVIRDNEAPVNEKYAKYVGLKRTFRLGVKGVARNMIKILKGARQFDLGSALRLSKSSVTPKHGDTR